MSCNRIVNESYIDIYLKKNNINLNDKQLDNIKDKINSLSFDDNYNYINNIILLREKMKDKYNQKSNDQKKYFIYNCLQQVNKETGEIKDYTYNNLGIFNSNEDFRYKNLNNLNNLNVKFEEKVKGKYLADLDKKYAYKKIARTMYLDYINKHKEKVFITFTLPSKHHQFKCGKNGLEKNFNYNGDKLELNIEYCLKHLNKMHQYFYHTLKFKIRRKLKKQGIKEKELDKNIVDFIKILEPHKNLTPHLHSLFYINNEFINIINEVFDMTKEKFKLEQVKLEILTNAKSSTYLNKYLIKTVKSENTFFNEYRRYFSNIRYFSSSNYRHTNQSKIDLVYKYLYQSKPKLIEQYKKSNKPLYYIIENLIKNEVFTFEEKEIKRVAVDFKRMNNELEIEKEDYKEIEKNVEFDLNNYWSFGLTKEYKTSKLNWLKYVKKVKNNRLKNKIIKNITDYVKIVNTKTITKMFYKNKEVLNFENWEFLHYENDYFNELKNNPFESNEAEELVFKMI